MNKTSDFSVSFTPGFEVSLPENSDPWIYVTQSGNFTNAVCQRTLLPRKKKFDHFSFLFAELSQVISKVQELAKTHNVILADTIFENDDLLQSISFFLIIF